MPVKFASCDCTADAEDWEHTGFLESHDEHGDGTAMFEYTCGTCGERATRAIPSTAV